MNLAIIGNGEMALELYSLIMSTDEKEKYNKIFFVDIKEDKENNVISEREFFDMDKEEHIILIAMGEPFMRLKMAEKYSALQYKMTTFIHPMTCVSADAKIGKGSIILPFAYIAQDVEIGENTLIHSGVKIENDCRIGNNNFINGNAFIGAKTDIGNNCFIGPGSTIRDNLVIGDNSIIGMGSVVTKSAEKDSIYYGNPAIKVKENLMHKVFK